MYRAYTLLVIIFLVCLTCTGCAAKQSQIPTQIIAFGDETTDNGLGLQISKKDVAGNVVDPIILPTSPLYWQGRWSNGPAAVEVLSQHLGAKLTDYAISFALSDTNSLIETGMYATTGLLSQVKTYNAEVQGKADPNALYFIFITQGNDFWITDPDTGDYDKAADALVSNIQTAVGYLGKMGAKRFMVVNHVDMTNDPGFADRNMDIIKQFQTRVNTQLLSKMDDLSKSQQLEINVFDIQAVIDKIRSNPQKYGLKNLTDPCIQDYWATTACTNPDEYYFWDPFHTTSKVNQAFGEEMAAVFGK